MVAKLFNTFVGQSLNEYQIVSLLGEGHMGQVFKARDLTLQRDVALKVLPARLAGQPDFRERFLEAARTAARLDHPNIVKVLDFGQDHAMLYIVMESWPGETLRRMMVALHTWHKWIILSEAVGIVLHLALALDYAHRQGVLHRSVQPNDIMFKPEPSESLPYRPVLIDLGLASLGNGRAFTHNGGSHGTPAYRSPEQVLGGPTDARSDIYSLGVLLYELAVGQLPFPPNADIETIYRRAKLPPRPRSIRPELPEPVAQIILKASAYNPAERFASAAEMAEILGKIRPWVTNVPTGEATSLIWLCEDRGAAPRPPELAEMSSNAPSNLGQDRILILEEITSAVRCP